MKNARGACVIFGCLALLGGCRDEGSQGASGGGGGSGGAGTGGVNHGSGGSGGQLVGGQGASGSGGTVGGVDSFGPIAVGATLQPFPGSSSTRPGTVTSIVASGDHARVTVSYPPQWACPAKSLVDMPATNSTAPTDPALVGTTCAGLAGLRTAGLKAQAYAALIGQRNALASANCSPTAESRCVDRNGVVANWYDCYGGQPGGSGGLAAGGPFSGTGGSSSVGGTSGATSYSTTNTQVVDVDEADYVKNDGNTIFLLGSDGLHVIDAWPAAEAHALATVKLTGEPRRLFLDGTRLVVYARIASSDVPNGAGTSNPSDQGCTYGYGCRFTSDGGHTLVTVFDVTQPAQPRELMRYELSGAYVASRRIGHAVYTVVNDLGAPQVPGIDVTVKATSYQDLDSLVAQRKLANDALIDTADQGYFLPWMRHAAPGAQAMLDTACNNALITSGAQGTSFLSLTAFDLGTLAPMTRTVVGSNPGYVYASTSALYVAVDQAPAVDPNGASSSYGSYQAQSTAVHKFALAGRDTSYVGSVGLPGHILNQFAMDETDGVLRVASTKGWVPEANVSSVLSTFGPKAGSLVKLGEVTGIAPGEDIRSVRFDGARGYVVTFKKTDPLFVFDLSDAAAPQLQGELMIPGFSTYMQPLDPNHLLAIGFDADDQGSFAFFNGLQIQIFDVTDLANPKLAFKQAIGTRGSGSEALTNHLAFNYFAPKKMLALPITVCEGGGNGVYGDQLTFAGLMVFDVSLDTGIKEHGRLPFVDPSTVSSASTCQSWWTNTTSLVKRSIFMDDWVYGLTDTQLKVASLDALGTALQTIPLVGP